MRARLPRYGRRRSGWRVAEPDPGGDDLRGGDDVHRPDDRLDRCARNPEGAAPHEHRHAMGDQRLPAVARGAVRVRRPARRHGRAPQDGDPRRDPVRRVFRNVRADPEGQPRRGLDRDVPRGSGCGRGDHVPGRARDRGADLRAARTGQGARDLLRHRRRPHGARPDPRRLPDAVDLARDLLGQPPCRRDRARPDRDLQTVDAAPPGADGLPGPRADRRRRGLERVRVPAVLDLGLEQPGHLGLHRRGGGAVGRVLFRRAAKPNRR